MSKVRDLSLKIKGIAVINFYLELKQELLDKQIHIPNYNSFTFEIRVSNNGLIKEDIFNSMIKMNVFLDKEKEIELGHIQILNVFEIKNLNKYSDKKKNTLNLPPAIESTIIGISLSHTRAVFLTKCAGTFLQNAVMPLLNPAQFLNADNKINEI